MVCMWLGLATRLLQAPMVLLLLFLLMAMYPDATNERLCCEWGDHDFELVPALAV